KGLSEWKVIILPVPYGQSLQLTWLSVVTPTRRGDLLRATQIHKPRAQRFSIDRSTLDSFSRMHRDAFITLTKQAVKVALEALEVCVEKEFSDSSEGERN